MHRSVRLTALLLLACSGPVSAQEAAFRSVPGAEDVAYDPQVPSPEQALGYPVGTRHTEPHRVVAYFEAVAEASPRVTVARHGWTHERRPLVHAIVTSAANQARIEEIREANLRLSDRFDSVGAAQLEAQPAIVLLAYSIHGNEASGTEAAMLTLHHLAAGQGRDVQSILDSVVVILDPMLNPDGRDRFVDWVNGSRGATGVSDPQDREHREPWPGGRSNHYWYDLNRDWLPARQPETRGRLQLFHEWRPQLVADYHEMGGDATYFFQPGVPGRTHPNTPERNQELTREIALYHADALDRLGQLYFSEEVFDDFYYGKGSTYPDVNGAVGILFEQASSRGLEAETDNGPLHFGTTVRNQFATSLSTLRAARDLRLDLLSLQRDFYATAERFSAETGLTGYVLDLKGGRSRALELAELLTHHRIRAYDLARELRVGERRFQPGRALVVPAAQPQARLLDAAFRSVTAFEDSLFYDVSAWTLPLAFDVEVVPLTEPDLPLGAAWSPERVEGPAIQPAEMGGIARVVPWDGLPAARFLVALQRSGLRARLMSRGFTVRTPEGAESFGPGALVVPLVQPGWSRDSVARALADAAGRSRVDMAVALSSLTSDGPDLGASGASVLARRRLALLTGPGTSASRTGEVWEFLSADLGLPTSLLDVRQIGQADLSRYDVIVLAGGTAGDSSALAALGEWVERGGRLIALGSAVEDVVRGTLLDLTSRPFDLDSLTAGVPWADRAVARGAHAIGGAILETRLDPTHPLAFGIGGRLPTFRSNGSFYDPGASVIVVGRYPEDPLLGGYLSEARAATVPGTAAVVVERRGRGRTVAILDEPVYRGFWLGSARLLANAVLLGEAF